MHYAPGANRCEHWLDKGVPIIRAADICAKAAELVGGERDRTHGSKRRNFENICAVWNAYLFEVRPEPLKPLEADEIGVLMVLFKAARTQHGAFNLDDYIDMAGYAGCAGEIADQLQRDGQ